MFPCAPRPRKRGSAPPIPSAHHGVRGVPTRTGGHSGRQLARLSAPLNVVQPMVVNRRDAPGAKVNNRMGYRDLHQLSQKPGDAGNQFEVALI
jgi:hypothetical protein